ncbi:MAG: hypothetical protein AABX44_02535 [Nanoarchaeota archaeon]
MAKNTSTTFSFITLLLSLLFFVLPAIVGNSALVAFFLISFVLLIVAFVTSISGLTDEMGKYSALSLFSLVVSIIFFLFLIIGALLQV